MDAKVSEFMAKAKAKVAYAAEVYRNETTMLHCQGIAVDGNGFYQDMERIRKTAKARALFAAWSLVVQFCGESATMAEVQARIVKRGAILAGAIKAGAEAPGTMSRFHIWGGDVTCRTLAEAYVLAASYMGVEGLKTILPNLGAMPPAGSA